MFTYSLLILIGFILLIKGADCLVDGACSIARRFGLSDMVIGMTIVAFGTSTPELSVSLIAGLRGNGGIAIGNILGSNIANLGLVLGAAGLLRPITIQRGAVWKEIPFCLGTASLLAIMLIWQRASPSVIARGEGLILLAALAAYFIFMFRASREPPAEMQPGEHVYPPLSAWLLMLAGLAGLLIGGELITRNAVTIARRLHVSQEMIALTVVALGTSLPEVAASIAAVMKNKSDLAIGNVVGSNILNTCLVLGLAGSVTPLSSPRSFAADAGIGLGCSMLLFLFMFSGGRHKLDRWEAALFCLIYAGYLVMTILRM